MLERVAIGESDFDLFYQTVGDGPPIVFCHGFSGNHLSWWQQLPTFAEDYRCVALDQRCFGRSVDSAGVGVAALADDLLALLDHLDIDRAALVGHSMGGWPVGSVATQQPDCVAALVLSATPGGLIDPDRHRELMAAADSPPDVDPLSAELAFLSTTIGELNTDAPAEWDAARTVLDELPLDAERVADADIPTLLVAGEADAFMPPAAVDAVADRLDAETTVMDGAGHSVYFEQPDAFNQRVGEFLDPHRPW